MSRLPSRPRGPVGWAALCLAAACAGTDPLSVEQAPGNVGSGEDEPSLTVLATTATEGGTRPSMAMLPKAQDTLAVGDSVQYVPTGSMVRRDIRQYWYTTTPEVATVTQSGWVRALTVGTTMVIMVPQAKPFPTAFTRLTVIKRSPAGGVTGPAPIPPADSQPAPAPAPPAPAPTPTPSGTAILPGESIQAKVDAAPAGTQFVLKPGVHRLQSVTPKDGNAFVGEPGAVLAGARLLTAFTREGAYWVAGGQTQESAPHGSCWAAYPRCNRAHDLFRDDVPLRHVASLAELGPGRWYFDYAADKIYLADDPAGHTVEASVTAQAFAGPASNVTVRGLVVEKYANPAQAGAIDAGRGAGWVVRDTEVRLTHGTGIRIGTRAQVVGNNVHDNGQLGVGGVGDNALVENNTIAYNNRAGYDAGWEGGGTKFASTHDLVVRGNFVHHNQGPGLWTDIDNMRTLYEGNRVEDNRESGIFHEISYDAVIRNNVVRRNGFGFSGWLYGAGILVSSSSNVEVVGNTVEDNAHGITGIDQQRGTGRYGPWILLNLLVHQNTVRVGATGKAAGVAGDLALFTAARNIRYRANRYQLGANPWPFEWDSRGLLEAGWRAAGQDADGTFTR